MKTKPCVWSANFDWDNNILLKTLQSNLVFRHIPLNVDMSNKLETSNQQQHNIYIIQVQVCQKSREPWKRKIVNIL